MNGLVLQVSLTVDALLSKSELRPLDVNKFSGSVMSAICSRDRRWNIIAPSLLD